MSDTGLSYFANDVRFIVQHAADAHTVRMDDVFEELSQVGFAFGQTSSKSMH